MEGRWGTRIFGFVERGHQATRFCLIWTQDKEQTVTLDRLVNNNELELARFNLYGEILNKLSAEMEQQLKQFQIVPEQ